MAMSRKRRNRKYHNTGKRTATGNGRGQSRNQPGGIWTKKPYCTTAGSVCTEWCNSITMMAPCYDGDIDMNWMNINGYTTGDFSPCGPNGTGSDGWPDYYDGGYGSTGTCEPGCTGAGQCITDGCAFTADDVCNQIWADECGSGCTAYPDSNCDGWGSGVAGYTCCLEGQTFEDGQCIAQEPFTGPGLGHGSGDSTGDGLLNVQDVVNTVAWIVCDEGSGIISDTVQDYSDCVVSCNPGSPYCPPEGWLSFEELTHELLLNADTNQDGRVNVMDVVQVVNDIVNPEDRALAEKELRKLNGIRGSGYNIRFHNYDYKSKAGSNTRTRKLFGGRTQRRKRGQ